MRIVSIGEILWDVIAGSERLGGAPFNFAARAARLGHEAIFVSAVGDDARGHAALARAEALGVRTDFLRVVSGAATGIVSVRVDAAGQPDFTIHRPAAYDMLELSDSDLETLASLRPEWLYYGTLYQNEQTRKLAGALSGARRFYDVNLRRDCYTLALVQELMARSHVVKLNEDEAAVIDPTARSLEEFTDAWSRGFGWQAVAVTRGARGCSVRIGGDYAEPPGYPVQVADTVGAGDAFAAAFLHGFSQGWDAQTCGAFANRAGAEAASQHGGLPE